MLFFWQNGTFEPVHEIQKFFWPKAFFWSIMKMAVRKFFCNTSQGLPNPGFMQEKLQKGDFLQCPMMKTNFNPFFRFYISRMHDFFSNWQWLLLLPLEWDFCRCAVQTVQLKQLLFICGKLQIGNGFLQCYQISHNTRIRWGFFLLLLGFFFF